MMSPTRRRSMWREFARLAPRVQDTFRRLIHDAVVLTVRPRPPRETSKARLAEIRQAEADAKREAAEERVSSQPATKSKEKKKFARIVPMPPLGARIDAAGTPHQLLRNRRRQL